MKRLESWKKWVFFLALLIGGVGGAALLRGGEKGAEYKTAKVEQGDIVASVSATGKVNAKVTV
ncbi:MAG TPA: hypothetical protein VFA47_07700, partial [Candidatus Manganitrophaceae bacterium]|nr:hypothetical protein [Candidatus Manganitrophaceae bacterium]